MRDGISDKSLISSKISGDTDIVDILSHFCLKQIRVALVLFHPPTEADRVTHCEIILLGGSGYVLLVSQPVLIEINIKIEVSGILEMALVHHFGAQIHLVFFIGKKNQPSPGIVLRQGPARTILQSYNTNEAD
ncbi:MAG: hypothetical protein A3G43_12925 [Ignavibacteria bacterium RIFCSPLOWO2_12_FULL_56_21]|nr:MAG: hypothetical protein A3G43_12925 [Ignavibacteria bacterium RIFCSPLOWO2_12_FULL_56_21]